MGKSCQKWIKCKQEQQQKNTNIKWTQKLVLLKD